MRRSLYLYLLIISVLLNIFTYVYFTRQPKTVAHEATAADDTEKLRDSLNVLYNNWVDASYFDLSGNQNAQEYFDNQTGPNAIPSGEVAQLVTDRLLDHNNDKEGNEFTGYEPMNGQKFIINKARVLNHRWIIADFSNGEMWGETLIKYFINDDRSVDFERIESTLYAKQPVQHN